MQTHAVVSSQAAQLVDIVDDAIRERRAGTNDHDRVGRDTALHLIHINLANEQRAFLKKSYLAGDRIEWHVSDANAEVVGGLVEGRMGSDWQHHVWTCDTLRREN